MPLSFIRRISTATSNLVMKHEGVEIAGYIAYTALVSLFPFVIFLFSLASVFSQEILARNLLDDALASVPDAVANSLRPLIIEILSGDRPGLLTLGGAVALWVASSGVEALRVGLNRAYAVDETRFIIHRRVQSFCIVIVMAALGLTLSALMIIGPVALAWLTEHSHLPLTALARLSAARYALSFVLLVAMFSAMYKLLPNTALPWRRIWPGVLLSALLWLAAASLFSLYLLYFNQYAITYGSLGGIIITLLFLHVSSIIIILGAEYNALGA